MGASRQGNDPLRGEVWFADLGIAAKARPILILSRNDAEPPRRITIYAPITSKNRGSENEVELIGVGFLSTGSTVNLQGIASAETRNTTVFSRRMGTLPADEMARVEKAVRYALDIT
jgi:mRNA interferase MazF